MSDMLDSKTSKRLQNIPQLKTNASPGSSVWCARLKEEIACLVQCIKQNKSEDLDWFTIHPSKDGVFWSGKCWVIHELQKYELPFEFELPAAYPTTAPEIKLPTLLGKTEKMYRGGAICLTVHFKPLWARNCPKYGVAHALCLGLAPWLAAEVPYLAATGALQPEFLDWIKQSCCRTNSIAIGYPRHFHKARFVTPRVSET